jgi:excinuclease ABC subunit A
VGTVTEIYDYLRLLYARLGTPHCPRCHVEIQSRTPQEIAEQVAVDAEGRPAMVLAPIVRERKGEYREDLAKLLADGYVRARIDGTLRRLDEGEIALERYKKHTIEVVLDRLTVGRKERTRLVSAVEKAVAMAEGVVHVLVDDSRLLTYATARSCPKCGLSLPEMEPRLFSFNAPQGACPSCNGLGERREFDPEKVVPDPGLSITEGAIACLTKEGRVPFMGVGLPEIRHLSRRLGFDLETPWRKLPAKVRKALLLGDEELLGGSRFTGVIPEMELAYKYTQAPFLLRWARIERCRACGGQRLRPEALAVTFRGRRITDLSASTVSECLEFFRDLQPSPREDTIGREVFKEIRTRLEFLLNVGLDYLTLDRSAATLAGGEAQRIRLASQVGSGLRGVLYVLDEPSIGLHHRDNERLLATLAKLRDQGNTVVVVEHDLDTIRAADHVIDVGPGAGHLGGKVVFQGPPGELTRADFGSLTAQYLRGEREIAVPGERRSPGGPLLTVRGARLHNLKSIDVPFPLGRFIAVTGVSGSGKSSLVDGVLRRALELRIKKEADPGGAPWEGLENASLVDKVIEIDQSPIGRTPRSNPATYTKVFDLIRDLYAQLPESRVRGYAKGRFSFNVPGGRCETCGGAGVTEVELQFLAPVDVPCDDCAGRRFNPETLEILYRGKSITDVLAMTVDDARTFFAHQPKVKRILDTMESVGLGYVQLGQPSTTLSGGEAQRVKLASELRRPATGKTLYILDEPTTGLHVADIQHLIDALQRLVGQGNTVVVIEHNLDVVKVADHVIDLGPEGGAGGGRVVAAGTPEEVAAAGTETGLALRSVLPGHAPWRAAEPRATYAAATAFRGLRVTGARKHNLKSVDVDVPESTLTVITGVSGSGKTSLAFDTLFAEGQRRYVESLSTYARRFLGRLDKAPVDRIEGLAPAIAIDQKTSPRTPRSTVATVTEIYDYLRLLFARVGTPHCPTCDLPLEAHTPSGAARSLLAARPGARGWLVAPLYRRGQPSVWEGPRDLEAAADALVRQGYLRVLVDGKERELAAPGALGSARSVELVIDRVTVAPEGRKRLAEGFEAAYRLAKGRAAFRDAAGAELRFTRVRGCPSCGQERPGEIHPRAFSFNSHQGACGTCDGLGEDWRGNRCKACKGNRLRPESLAVQIEGRNIIEATELTVSEAQRFFAGLRLTPAQALVAEEVLREVRQRLRFLEDTGLEYLTLNRQASTLSGGEAQRIRLASQIGLGLTGCLYVLDEPTVGLHPRDTDRLLASLLGLRDLGNTVVVVEHDPQTIRAADRVIDIGPGAGDRGGEIVFAGTPQEITRGNGPSATAAFLSGRRAIPVPAARGRGKPGVSLYGARQHNLKGIDATFLRGHLTCVTGVSGSGKSTLVLDTLQRAVSRDLGIPGGAEPGAHRALSRDRTLRKLVSIDQSPLGRSPSSNPATYTGVLDPIRSLFASLPEAQVRGYDVGRFSFNNADGQCAGCQGRGAILVEMHFLSDVWVTCEACKGKRYNAETLAVTYRGKSIADVLEMEVGDALAFFAHHRRIARILQTLADVGLGYMRLGQSAVTLSGGEAQRVKLGAELCHKSRGDTLYVLDEPTTGLHLADVEKLVAILRRLTADGNAVVVIEHNLEVVKVADRVIDLGPEAGDRGGEIVAEGTPEEVARSPASHTGRFLRPVLEASRREAAGELFSGEAAR